MIVIDQVRRRWAQTSLVTRVTLWYTLLLGALLVVIGLVVAGTLTRWLEADALNQLGMQAQEVRVALGAAAQRSQPFSVTASRVLSDVLGRDVQASIWASDGSLIARSEGFFFPQEALSGVVRPVKLMDAGVIAESKIADAKQLSDGTFAIGLPAKPALVSTDTIGQLSDRLYLNVSMVRQTLVGASNDRVAMLVMTLDNVPADLVASSDAYPDVPRLILPTFGPDGPHPQQAVIALSTSLNREAGGVTSVLSVVAIAGIVALVLGGLIARRIVRHSLRPIDTLARASQQLAAGDLATRVPVPSGRDEVSRLAGSFNDMAVQLDCAFTAQRAFVADASHELRTPLAALRGQVDVMRRALPDEPADADRLATSMRRELARLSRLVDDLLVLARLDALGSAALALRSVDVCSVAEDVCAQVVALPTAKDRELKLETSGPVRITADGERLHQVLLNLVANAVEHTPGGGTVSLAVAPSPSGAHIEVRDTGSGIPSSHLPNIFDRFYRADGTRRRVDGGGAGLGLSIARAIVEAHGGTIAAANGPPGGATFTVEIPSQP